ncbi:hypothetical protein Neosp_011169 [[Neocosmospora] mangrovei]
MAELHAVLPGLKRQDLRGNVFDTLPSEGSASFGDAVSSSRLPLEWPLAEDVDKLARVLELIGPSDEASKSLQAGASNPSIAGSMIVSSVTVENAPSPAWRDVVVYLIAKESWKDFLPYIQANATYGECEGCHSAQPSSRLWNINGADALEPDWQRAFWGPNYEKLLDVKHKYNPDGFFWCKKCVGSEAWVEQLDGAFCRVADGLLAVKYRGGTR